MFVGSVERLKKRLTGSYRRTLFGSMVNLWLFDWHSIRPDKSSGSALALLSRSAADPTPRLWHLAKDTCPLPLLDHWQSPVLALLRECKMLCSLRMALGPLQGFRLAIDVPAVSNTLGDLIRQGVLTVYAPLPKLRPKPSTLA